MLYEYEYENKNIIILYVIWIWIWKCNYIIRYMNMKIKM